MLGQGMRPSRGGVQRTGVTSHRTHGVSTRAGTHRSVVRSAPPDLPLRHPSLFVSTLIAATPSRACDATRSSLP